MAASHEAVLLSAGEVPTKRFLGGVMAKPSGNSKDFVDVTGPREQLASLQPRLRVRLGQSVSARGLQRGVYRVKFAPEQHDMVCQAVIEMGLRIR